MTRITRRTHMIRYAFFAYAGVASLLPLPGDKEEEKRFWESSESILDSVKDSKLTLKEQKSERKGDRSVYSVQKC